MTTVRVASYNVRSLRDDRAALGRVLRGLAADVACLQEAPRFLGWRASRAALARTVGMRVVAGRRPAGLAILAGSRARLIERGFHLLSPVPGLHRRGLAIAVLEVTGFGRLIAASTHLDLAAEPRLRHAREILAFLDQARRRHPAPVMLAGDVNEGPDGPAWRCFLDRFRDCHAAVPRGTAATFPAATPSHRIDAIFVERELSARAVTVPVHLREDVTRASDHLPVVAEITHI